MTSAYFVEVEAEADLAGSAAVIRRAVFVHPRMLTRSAVQPLAADVS